MSERVIDARSDGYVLGAVTYEMLVGEASFTGPSVQAIVARVLPEEPRSTSPADRFEYAKHFIVGGARSKEVVETVT